MVLDWKKAGPARHAEGSVLSLGLNAKGAFTSENALFKLVFCAIKQITAKWNMPISNWSLAISQLDIYFPDRLKFGR